jgi:hypothetical protein
VPDRTVDHVRLDIKHGPIRSAIKRMGLDAIQWRAGQKRALGGTDHFPIRCRLIPISSSPAYGQSRYRAPPIFKKLDNSGCLNNALCRKKIHAFFPKLFFHIPVTDGCQLPDYGGKLGRPNGLPRFFSSFLVTQFDISPVARDQNLSNYFNLPAYGIHFHVPAYFLLFQGNSISIRINNFLEKYYRLLEVNIYIPREI